MVIAVVLHLLCYEERKSNDRSVLYRHKKSENVDYSSVWKLEIKAPGLDATPDCISGSMLIGILLKSDYSAV